MKKPRCCCSQSGHPSDSRTGFAQGVGGQDTTTGNLIPVEPTSKYQDHVKHDDPIVSRKDTQTPRKLTNIKFYKILHVMFIFR